MVFKKQKTPPPKTKTFWCFKFFNCFNLFKRCQIIENQALTEVLVTKIGRKVAKIGQRIAKIGCTVAKIGRKVAKIGYMGSKNRKSLAIVAEIG